MDSWIQGNIAGRYPPPRLALGINGTEKLAAQPILAADQNIET